MYVAVAVGRTENMHCAESWFSNSEGRNHLHHLEQSDTELTLHTQTKSIRNPEPQEDTVWQNFLLEYKSEGKCIYHAQQQS